MQSAGISILGVLNLAQSFGYDKVNRLISAVWCIEGLGSTGREPAFKVENAVDMETEANVAVTTHGGAVADTTTVEATVIEAGVAVAEVAGEDAPAVNADGVQEIVADRGYYSNEVVRGMEELQVQSYIAEPERGPRNWEGKAAEKAAFVCESQEINEAPKLPHPIAHPDGYFWRLGKSFTQQFCVCTQELRLGSLVRDQEVGGSNQLAPTKSLNNLQAADPKTAHPFAHPH